MIRTVPAALDQWNDGIRTARDAYHAHPSTDWCIIRLCWNQRHGSGMCSGHRRQYVGGVPLELDEQVAGAMGGSHVAQ